jgi:hypothetical protein
LGSTRESRPGSRQGGAFRLAKYFQTVALLLIVAALSIIAMAWLNPRLTRYIESDSFRAEMEKETAKGLHFPGGHYEPIKRTGTWRAESAGFGAKNGRKAMTSLDARGVTAKFNPWGLFLRRWQLDEVHIGTGEVGIQTYEPKPEPSPSKPWYHIFLPDRVYLRRVWSEPADVTWRFREERAGFFRTHLLITPHGRDFEYQATGGTLKMALIPDLPLRHTHLLITRTQLTLYQLDLAAGPESDGFIHAEGTAGTREDRSVDFKLSFGDLPVREWLPVSWKDHVAGTAAGEMHWRGPNPKLESASVQGSFRVGGGHVRDLPFLQKLVVVTGKQSIVTLDLSDCSVDVDWDGNNGELQNIAIEDQGKFRIEGGVTIRHRSLGGAVQLGVAREYLAWLPRAEEVFPREHDGYLWTTVHLSGTIDQPGQDLSPRLTEALKESPGAFLALIFRQFGASLREIFGSH